MTHSLSDFSNVHCQPIEPGTPALSSDEVKQYLSLLDSYWSDIDELKINKVFKFHDFKGSVDFVNQVAKIAEQEQHHPDIHIYFNQVTLELWTHDVSGLSVNDFIMAAKIDELTTQPNSTLD